MELQPLLGIQPLRSSQRVVFVDVGQRLQGFSALLGEAVDDVYKVPAPVREAVGDDGFEAGGKVVRERVGHVDGRR